MSIIAIYVYLFLVQNVLIENQHKTDEMRRASYTKFMLNLRKSNFIFIFALREMVTFCVT